MYFCSECGNLYDITNVSPESTQSSETVSEPSRLTNKNSTRSGGAKNKQKDIQSANKQIYFVCKTCGNTENVKPRTLVLSKKSHDVTKEYYGNVIKPENIINIPTLPRTRDYICPNKSCPTHAHPETRDAVMSRIGNSFQMQYVCSVCSTMWKQN